MESNITQTKIQDAIQSQYLSLPQEMKVLFNDESFLESVREAIAKLETNQQNKISIENEVALVLFGLEPFGELDTNLMEHTTLDQEQSAVLLAFLLEKIDEYQMGTDTEADKTSTNIEGPKESPILQATRTMQGDIAEAQGDDTPRWQTIEDGAESGVEKQENEDLIPRYSKPLTDTPKYE